MMAYFVRAVHHQDQLFVVEIVCVGNVQHLPSPIASQIFICFLSGKRFISVTDDDQHYK